MIKSTRITKGLSPERYNKTGTNTIIGNIVDGGIGITDIDSKLKAIKVT